MADEMVVPILSGDLIQFAPGNFIAVDQTIAAEGIQIAIHGGGADVGRFGAHRFNDLVESCMLALAGDHPQDQLALRREPKTEFTDPLFDFGVEIADCHKLQNLSNDNFRNKHHTGSGWTCQMSFLTRIWVSRMMPSIVQKVYMDIGI